MTNKFHSIGEMTGADRGMADYMRLYGFEEVDKPDDAQIIIFNGGADIATALYHQEHYQSGRVTQPSARDKREMAIWKMFAHSPVLNPQNKLMLGVCRGAQFCNVMAGGSLWQDVDNHGRDHMIHFSIGSEWGDEPSLVATSTHHQMMRPGKGAELLAYATEAKHFNGANPYKDQAAMVDTEIVWYPGRKALCIQGHPEYVPDGAFGLLCAKLINHYHEQVQSSAA